MVVEGNLFTVGTSTGVWYANTAKIADSLKDVNIVIPQHME